MDDECNMRLPPGNHGSLAAILDALADAARDPSDAVATTLAQHIRALRGQLDPADAPGVGELLRCWEPALQDIARRGAHPSPADIGHMQRWFVALREHLDGTLVPTDMPSLARLPTQIHWLPRLSNTFAHVILRRLMRSACERPGPGPEDGPRVPPVPRDTAITPPQEDDLPGPSPTPLWIGPDELELVRGAILSQVLPLAQPWADARAAGPESDQAADAIAEELGYQCGLLGNALELLGTRALAAGTAAIRDGIAGRHAAVDAECVARWSASLLDALSRPGLDTADALAELAGDLPGLGPAWRSALRKELARIVIGLDPMLAHTRVRVASTADVSLAPADDVLPSVMEGMLRELPGNAERLGASLRALVSTRAPAAIDEARRIAHTLKGDANTVGVRGLANLTHVLEDILLVVARDPGRLGDDDSDVLTSAGDCVEDIADHLLGRSPAPAPAVLCALYQRALDLANALADAPAAEHAPGDPAAAVPAAHPDPDARGPAAAAAQNDATRALTVPSTLLDELQRLAGESLVTARQIDEQVATLATVHREQRASLRITQDLIGRLDDLVALRGAALQSVALAKGGELDPLEIDQYTELHVISRQLLEAHADGDEFMRRIDGVMGMLAELRSAQERLNSDLQRTTLRTRTVPFGQVAPRLQRIVRQTAKLVSREVALDVIGGEVPIDAETLEKVVEPLAHLLRNAIDHGIEDTDERLARGKPATGRIVVRVGLQGDAAVVDVEDDGRGLDHDAILRRAVAIGLWRADQPRDARQLERLVLLPGFSTREAASATSGRGMGMDVVAQRVASLRGSLVLGCTPGRGTRVQMRLPVTQTLANVVIARGQRQASALVASSVERVVSFGAGECRLRDGGLVVVVEGIEVQAWPLEAFHGERADPSSWIAGDGVGLLTRDAVGAPHVVLVHRIDEVRPVVVKPLGTGLPPIPAVRGITQLGDGSLAPVLDLDVLLQSALDAHLDAGALAPPVVPTARVVVADDSLSVRRAMEQLMRDAGFDVATARDGLEALAEVQARPTSALLVDLEMPRMNGLELTRHLRTLEDTRDLPVVMITSRATGKHLAMAEQAGVTHVLAKPVGEDALVQLVRGLVAARG